MIKYYWEVDYGVPGSIFRQKKKEAYTAKERWRMIQIGALQKMKFSWQGIEKDIPIF